MSYKKAPKLARILPRGQSRIFGHKIAVYHDFYHNLCVSKSPVADGASDSWKIRLIGDDDFAGSLLKRDIEKFGEKNFEQVIKRNILVPLVDIPYSNAVSILNAKLPVNKGSVTQSEVNAVSLRGFSLLCSDLGDNWLFVHDASTISTISRPKFILPKYKQLTGGVL